MIKIYNEDCLKTMARIPENYVDLTVTSPPYDKLRTYNNELQWNETIWKAIIKDLFRVTKKGGVVVWVVSDATVKGSETGTSFKQALWAKECGFNLHDTMLYLKEHLAFPESIRYYNAFEYMFIWSKGTLKTFNPIKDRKNKTAGQTVSGCERQKDGSLRPNKFCAGNIIKEYGTRWNYWLMHNAKRGIETQHPAVFPEQLAKDHITSWSNEGDLVYDPFTGSGTTAKMAKLLKRNFIGSEKVKKYCEIAEKRIKSIDSIQVDLF